jgi:hypothetical protein
MSYLHDTCVFTTYQFYSIFSTEPTRGAQRPDAALHNAISNKNC